MTQDEGPYSARPEDSEDSTDDDGLSPGPLRRDS
jgi:hypothetical protein